MGARKIFFDRVTISLKISGAAEKRTLSRGTRLVAFALLFATAALPLATAQEKGKDSNTRAATIKEGASLFRANCAPCHGLNARGGGRGPDLTSGRWTHGSTDDAIFRTISQGVPGTDMPANGFEDSEIRAIVAYLRSLAPSKQPAASGNSERGAKLFETAGCSKCHMVNGSGGRLGPDLSRVGAARSAAYMVESIREPDKQLSTLLLDPNNHYGVPLSYGTVTVVTPDGERIQGVALNEDTYTIQMMTEEQSLRFFEKKDAKEVIHEPKSLMPAYSESALNAAQLQDLIAYLETLRGVASGESKEGR
jgi:putative heme-binding domain-containing protein